MTQDPSSCSQSRDVPINFSPVIARHGSGAPPKVQQGVGSDCLAFSATSSLRNIWCHSAHGPAHGQAAEYSSLLIQLPWYFKALPRIATFSFSSHCGNPQNHLASTRLFAFALRF